MENRKQQLELTRVRTNSCSGSRPDSSSYKNEPFIHLAHCSPYDTIWIPDTWRMWAIFKEKESILAMQGISLKVKGSCASPWCQAAVIRKLCSPPIRGDVAPPNERKPYLRNFTNLPKSKYYLKEIYIYKQDWVCVYLFKHTLSGTTFCKVATEFIAYIQCSLLF